MSFLPHPSFLWFIRTEIIDSSALKVDIISCSLVSRKVRLINRSLPHAVVHMVMHKAENFISSALQHSPLRSSFKIYEMSLPNSLTFEEFTELISSLSIHSMCVFSLWTYSPNPQQTITASNYTIVDSSRAWKLCIDCRWCCKGRKDIMHAVFSFSRHIYVIASIYA